MLLIYQRVSTAEQAADDRSSLENQERIGRGFAMTKGFNQFDISCYVDAGVSASIPLRQRPQGKRLLEDAKAGDFVFASKLDRMFRSANDALNMSQIFLEKDINLVLFDLGSEPINNSGISQFFLTVISAVAALERATIRERMVGGKKAKKAVGGHVGGEPPYGYAIVGRSRAAKLVEVEEEQKVLTFLRERAQLSFNAAARELNAEGWLPRTGKQFHPMQVKRIMDRMREDAAN